MRIAQISQENFLELIGHLPTEAMAFRDVERWHTGTATVQEDSIDLDSHAEALGTSDSDTLQEFRAMQRWIPVVCVLQIIIRQVLPQTHDDFYGSSAQVSEDEDLQGVIMRNSFGFR